MDDALTFTIPETTVLDGVALKDAIGTGKIKLGLFSEKDGTFTDWGYEVGKTAAAKLLTRTIALPGGVTAKIGETEITDGKALMGDTVTVSMTSENRVTFFVDGAPVATGSNGNVYSASFTVTGNHTVTYEEAYAVSGTVKLDEAFNGLTVDLTKTSLTFENGDGAATFTDVVKSDGTFTVYLKNGSYKVRAAHPAYYAREVAVTIDNAGAAVNVVLALSAVTSGNSTYTVAGDGTLTGHTSGAGASEFYNFGASAAFTVETTVAACDLSVETYPQAGLSFITGGGNYLWTLFHEGNTDKWKILFVRQNGYSVKYYDEVDPTNGIALKADYDGTELKLYVNGELKATYSQDNEFINDNTFGGTITAGLTNVGTAGVFTNYRYIPR